MNTLARNVVPFPRVIKRVVPVFSADPRHAGLRFSRTTAEAFRDATYAGWFYPSPKRSLWRRLLSFIGRLS